MNSEMRPVWRWLLILLSVLNGPAWAERTPQPVPGVQTPMAQAPASLPQKPALPLRRAIGIFTRAYWGMSKGELRSAYPTKKLEQVCDEKGVECREATAWVKATDRVLFLFARDQLYRIEICPQLDETGFLCDAGDADVLVESITKQLKATPIFLPKAAEVGLGGGVYFAQHYQWGDEDSRFVVRIMPGNESTALIHFNPSLQAAAEKMLLMPWDCQSLRRSHFVEPSPSLGCGNKRARR